MNYQARNDKLAELGFDSYDRYLNSPRWKTLRAQVLARSEHRCQLCNRGKRLHVHHRSYHRLGTDNEGADLIVLCEKCHEKFHGLTPKKSEQHFSFERRGVRPLKSERKLAEANRQARKAEAKRQRREEHQRRQAKALERKKLARTRDWRDERQLLRPGLTYREIE